MDLETENRIAAILLKEAAELRREAQKEGALAYLRLPTVRSKPNSRFLTATVRGVQQANRAVEVSEMWRIRDKQIELDNRLRESRNRSKSARDHRNVPESLGNQSSGCHEKDRTASAGLSSKERSMDDVDPMEDEGLRDNEVEEFLHSRTKRGRGAVGSRMDEAGPYLPYCPDSQRNGLESSDWHLKRARFVLGPKKPSSLKYRESSDDGNECQVRETRKRRQRRDQVREAHKETQTNRREEKEDKGNTNQHMTSILLMRLVEH